MSANFRGKGGHPPTNFGFKKLESLAISLSRGVVCVILRLAVLIQYRRVTHRHTHRQTDTRTQDDGYYPSIACTMRVKHKHDMLT